MQKEYLDRLMIEYDWEKNTLDDNIEFIFFMLSQYAEYRKHLGLAKCSKKAKKS